MTAPARILVVDDHTMVRDMLCGQISAEPDLEVVGTASTGNGGVDAARILKPDLILMDIDMPGELCFTAARTIKLICPDARIVYLSAFFHDRYIEEALAAHASGYVTKDEPLEVVLDAIRRAVSGLAYFSPKVQARIVVDSSGMRLGDSTRSRASMLTQRELETVRYIARGLPKKDIAVLMHVTVRTVDMHTQNAMDKLDIHDRVELARFAIREGLAEA
jgi:DNA-binding NarL/FixJ family response regulator